MTVRPEGREVRRRKARGFANGGRIGMITRRTARHKNDCMEE